MTWVIGIAMLDVTSLTAMFVGSRGTRWSCQWRIRKWILFEAVRCWFISPSINCLYYVGGVLFRSEFSKVIFFRTFRSPLKKVFLEISLNSQENTCARISFLIKLFIKNETLAQVFSCEFCDITKNTFSLRTRPGDCFLTFLPP